MTASARGLSRFCGLTGWPFLSRLIVLSLGSYSCKVGVQFPVLTSGPFEEWCVLGQRRGGLCVRWVWTYLLLAEGEKGATNGSGRQQRLRVTPGDPSHSQAGPPIAQGPAVPLGSPASVIFACGSPPIIIIIIL